MQDTHNEGLLDLTSEEGEEEKSKSQEVKFQEKEYDPRPQEDSARRRIAYILLVILATIILWTFILLSACPNSVENVIKILQIILGPMIALVSAATGFYFGSKK